MTAFHKWREAATTLAIEDPQHIRLATPVVGRRHEAGKRRLAGDDAARTAASGEVKDLRHEDQALKKVVADLTLENRLLKKSTTGDEGDEA